MWFDRYRAVLCDLDGCLIAGDSLLPGALELADRAGERLWIISNNSTDTPHTLSVRLAGLGLRVPAHRIVLAGATAVEMLATLRPRARVWIYGTATIKELASEAGLPLDGDRPDFVLLTRDEHFGYAHLSHAVRLLQRGARLIVANRDAVHPGADGRSVVETGALLAALAACVPGIRYREIGKPCSVMYQAVLRRLGFDVTSILAIGDNPETDGEGARRMGIDCALVGPKHGASWRDLSTLLIETGDPFAGGTMRP